MLPKAPSPTHHTPTNKPRLHLNLHANYHTHLNQLSSRPTTPDRKTCRRTQTKTLDTHQTQEINSPLRHDMPFFTQHQRGGAPETPRTEGGLPDETLGSHLGSSDTIQVRVKPFIDTPPSPNFREPLQVFVEIT